MKLNRHYSRLSVAAALLIFPPLGFFLMYRDPHYHRRFAHLLYLSAATPLFLYLFYHYFVTPQLTLVMQSLGAPLPANSYTLLIIISLISLLQIPLGFILDRKIKAGSLSKDLLMVTIFILLANFFLTGYAITMAMGSILRPIYNLNDYLQ